MRCYTAGPIIVISDGFSCADSDLQCVYVGRQGSVSLHYVQSETNPVTQVASYQLLVSSHTFVSLSERSRLRDRTTTAG